MILSNIHSYFASGGNNETYFYTILFNIPIYFIKTNPQRFFTIWGFACNAMNGILSESGLSCTKVLSRSRSLIFIMSSLLIISWNFSSLYHYEINMLLSVACANKKEWWQVLATNMWLLAKWCMDDNSHFCQQIRLMQSPGYLQSHQIWLLNHQQHFLTMCSLLSIHQYCNPCHTWKRLF